MRPLFIVGCPRSGTTGLTNHLNRHESVLVCIERYKHIPERITPDLFTFDRILDYREGETNIPRERHVRLLEDKDPAKLEWVGDKSPRYFRYLDTLLANNPGARFIFMYRPVEELAESWEERLQNPRGNWPRRHNFEEAVRVWNSSLRCVRDFMENGLNPEVFIVSYHDFFGGYEEFISQISRFLGIEFDNSMRETWEEMSRRFEGRRRPKNHLSEEQLSFVRQNKDSAVEEWVLERIEKQRQMSWPAAGQPVRSAQQERVEELENQLVKERRKARQLENKSRHLKARVQRLEGQLQEIRSSNSWKLVSAVNSARAEVSEKVTSLLQRIRTEVDNAQAAGKGSDGRQQHRKDEPATRHPQNVSQNSEGPLPTFLIIGAQKSGTRWLRDNLHEHPEVFAAWEEVSFFNNRNNFKQDLDWYRRCFEGWEGEPQVGESTPGYMMLRENHDLVASRIQEALPGVKLIALLRNPVDRTYSAFLHNMRKGRISPETDILEYIRSVDPDQDRLRLIAGSWYAASLAPYVERFGDRLAVFLHDEVVSAPDRLYTKALEHIGASTDFLPEQLQKVRHKGRAPEESSYAGDKGGSQPLTKPRDLTPKERAEIYEYFRDDIERLEELLDWDLSLWRPPEEKATSGATKTDPKRFGRCEVCGHIGAFQQRQGSIREGYKCGNCSASLRYRHQAAVIVSKYTEASSDSFAELVKEPAFQRLQVYEPGLIGPFRKYLKEHPNYTTSYLWDEVEPGDSKDGVRCEDLERLTFDDESFDLVISSDIFEHVRKPYEAFAEVHRVLKTGGLHIFTVPLKWPLPESTVSRVDTSGNEDVSVLQKVYHGSPTDSEGSLVYTDFGLDIIDDMESIGFKTEMYRGVRYNVTFCAEKQPRA